MMNVDLEIAQKAKMLNIFELAKNAGIPEQHIEPYGRYKGKISLEFFHSLKDRKDGKLILVSAITPTPAGEGKTTTSFGLHDGFRKIGENSFLALREPSLGPVFGIKGGATGGGYSQVVPMEDINLHFTGDIAAVEKAHNLIAAASEIMAILCLAESYEDLKRMIGNIFIGFDVNKNPVFVKDLEVEGAAAALLKHALKPNLVQTLENNPVLSTVALLQILLRVQIQL